MRTKGLFSHIQTRLAIAVFLAGCAVLISGLFSHTKIFHSSEVKFSDSSKSGLAIVPASCPSDPHWVGECNTPPTAVPNDRCALSASTYDFTLGQSTTLYWSTVAGYSFSGGGLSWGDTYMNGSIDQGVGSVARVGSMVLTPITPSLGSAGTLYTYTANYCTWLSSSIQPGINYNHCTPTQVVSGSYTCTARLHVSCPPSAPVIYNNTCVASCPLGYTADTYGLCIYNGVCPTGSTQVDSGAGSQTFTASGSFVMPQYTNLTAECWGGGGAGAKNVFWDVGGSGGDSVFPGIRANGGGGGDNWMSNGGIVGGGGAASGGDVITVGGYGSKGIANGPGGAGGSSPNGGAGGAGGAYVAVPPQTPSTINGGAGVIPGGGGGGSGGLNQIQQTYGAPGGGGGGYVHQNYTYPTFDIGRAYAVTIGAGGVPTASASYVGSGGAGARGECRIVWHNYTCTPIVCGNGLNGTQYPSCTCPAGQSQIPAGSSTCSCPAGQYWDTGSNSCKVIPVCTGGQTWNGTACACGGATPFWNGSSCVASCSDTYFCSDSSCAVGGGSTVCHLNTSCVSSVSQTCPYGCSAGACLAAPSATVKLLANPILVRKGDPTRISWNSTLVSACTVTGSNGDTFTSGISSGAVGASCTSSASCAANSFCVIQGLNTSGNCVPSYPSSAIQAQTVYTIRCTANNGSTLTQSSSVNIIPVFCEPGMTGC